MKQYSFSYEKTERKKDLWSNDIDNKKKRQQTKSWAQKTKMPSFLKYLGRDDYRSKNVYSEEERRVIMRYRTLRNKTYRKKLLLLEELLLKYK